VIGRIEFCLGMNYVERVGNPFIRNVDSPVNVTRSTASRIMGQDDEITSFVMFDLESFVTRSPS